MIKLFLKNSIVYGLVNIFQKILDYIVNILFIYILSASEYGIISLLPLTMLILSPLISLQLGSSVTRFYYKYKKTGKEDEFLGSIMSFTVIISCLLVILLLLCSSPVWRLAFPGLAFMPYIAIGILVTAADSFNRMYITIMQIKKQVKRYAIYNNCYILFRLLVILVAIYLYKTALSYYLAYLFAIVSFVPVSIYLMRNDIKWNLKIIFLKEALKYSGYMLPVSVFIVANAFIDRHVILEQLDLNSLGVYSAGMNIGQIIYFMAIVFNTAFIPFFMQKYEENKGNFVTEIEPVYRLIFFILNIAALLLSVFSPLLKYLLPVSYHAAIAIVPLIAFLGVAQGLYQLYTNILSLETEMLRFKILGVLASLSVNIPLSYYLVYLWGINGAAYSSLLCMYISVLVYKLIVYKTKGPDLSHSFFIFPVCIFIIALILFRVEAILPFWSMLLIYSMVFYAIFYYSNHYYFKKRNFLIDNFRNLVCYVKTYYKR